MRRRRMPALLVRVVPSLLSVLAGCALRGQDVRRLDHALLLERGAALQQRLPPVAWVPGTQQLAVEREADGEARLVLRTPGVAEEQELLRARELGLPEGDISTLESEER